MTTLTSSAATLALETFRVQGDGCLAYLVVDEGSRTALAASSEGPGGVCAAGGGSAPTCAAPSPRS